VRAQTASGGSSDYLIHVWSSEDGLPQNSVNCLAQTPDGYLWIGTRSGGLARFDGNRFVIFNPQTTPELKDVEFETLSVDSRGTLWITAGNESAASMSDGKFHLVRERTAEPRWHPLNLIGEESNAVYLASFHPSVFRVPRNGAVNEAERIDLEPPPPTPAPQPVIQTGDGSLWYVTDNHLVARLDLSPAGGKRFTVFNLPSPAQELVKGADGVLWLATDRQLGVMTTNGFADRTPTNGSPGAVRKLVPTRDNGLWVWNGTLLRKLMGRRWVEEVKRFRPADTTEPLRFFADSQGGLWVIEYGDGLWHVRPDGTASLLTREDGLPSKFITCFLEDNEGNIWIGTKEAGLARIRPRQFKQYTSVDGIPGDVTQSVCEDAQGCIWVGTATGGLARKQGDKFVPVPLTPNPDPLIESVTVFPDATNGIWIGTLQGSVFRCVNDVVRCVNNEVSWSFPLERLRDHVANAMMEDSRGRVWFGNGAGAFYFQEGKLTTFDTAAGFVENIGVRALAEGPPGTLWFGTEPGDVWRIINDKPVRYHPPTEWPNARVSALLPEADGSLWVGTLGGGLLRLEDGHFTRITTQQGLPDNSITQLLEDDDGNLWGGTYAGIFRSAKRDLKDIAAGRVDEIAISVHGRFDGLPAQAYSGWFQPSCWRSRDGRLWFTTVKGLVVVNPREVTVNHRPPPVVIEELRVDGLPQDFKSIANNDGGSVSNPRLKINPGRHYLEFSFTGIDLTAPDKVRFKWRLEGLDTRWRDGMNQRFADYGPLPPGRYCFRVQAANSDGVWNETGASLAFVVLPYFWETWWFKTLLLVVLGSGLALAVTLAMRRRHRLELDRLEHSREMERERTRIAGDMHDEIGSKLARISFLSEVVKSQNHGGNQADGAVDSLSRTARDLLQSLDRMVWAVNPRNDSLEVLSAYLNRYAAEYFQNTAIRCRLSFPENLPVIQVSAETRHNIFLAFEEALTNIIKHSRATEVNAQLVCQNGVIGISIADNGRGFEVEVQSAASKVDADEHHGLSGMCQRMQTIGGKCQITSLPNGGTTIKFVLPLTKNNA
jgi:ligand-binding sensor domain-containing protein/signal transduction histidine kinase